MEVQAEDFLKQLAAKLELVLLTSYMLQTWSVYHNRRTAFP